ncbi:MAG: hypothetical protein JO335_04270 [Sphingomonas sp.]|nr:hypothetical protein [Sphingomonas sp.]
MNQEARQSVTDYYAQFGMLQPLPATEAMLLKRAVSRAIEDRRRRAQFFSEDIFGEPAWDILLELYYAELMQVRMTLARLYRRTGVAQTTAIRWLKLFERRGIVDRRDDPLDSRRIFITLTPSVSDAMTRFFQDPDADS